jgi:hypothetical protein
MSQTFTLSRLTVYTCKVCLFFACCLHTATIKVNATFLNIYHIRLVNLRFLYESFLKVDLIDRVHYPISLVN